MSLSVVQFTPLCERLRTALIWFVLCSSYFNSRLSARGYHGQEDIYAETYYFNSRLSARGYSNVDYGSLAEGEFQFTPLCERLPQHLGQLYHLWQISIHASLREATIMDYSSAFPPLFQFTPLCERLQQKQTIYSCISAQFLFN